MITITVGVLGLAFHSGNLGCSALSYSFMYILDEIAKNNDMKAEVRILSGADDKRPLKAECDRLSYSFVRLSWKNSAVRKKMLAAFDECDIIFDFTAGDSFTDIYGMSRFLKRSIYKKAVIKRKTPLVLGSQTYGPYKKALSRRWAADIIKKSYEVFARDEKSAAVAEKLGKRKPILTTDIAFFLPYEKQQADDGVINIGINVSGLLWNGGYTGNNQFGLTVDYPEYINRLLEKYSQDKKYKVHLIPHVVYKTSRDVADNDWYICNDLAEKYSNVRIAPFFESPMQAKSYIAGMDVFVGARMHATVAAYSSGVAAIPFSYSRKFEGLYESLNYPYVISGTVLTTDEATEKTIGYIDDIEQLRKNISDYSSALGQKKEYMMREYARLLTDLCHEECVNNEEKAQTDRGD